MKMYLPSSFILKYVRAEMNVHAFMNELRSKGLCDIQEKLKILKHLCTKSMESCHSCRYHIFGQSFYPERAIVHNCCIP